MGPNTGKNAKIVANIQKKKTLALGGEGWKRRNRGGEGKKGDLSCSADEKTPPGGRGGDVKQD